MCVMGVSKYNTIAKKKRSANEVLSKHHGVVGRGVDMVTVKGKCENLGVLLVAPPCFMYTRHTFLGQFRVDL